MDYTGPGPDDAGPRRPPPQLEAARAEFPGWDIREVFGGWEAVPAGTPVVTGMYLDTLTEKLRAREQQ